MQRPQHGSLKRRLNSREWYQLATVFVLGIALLLRFTGINWDGDFALHPDERRIVMETDDFNRTTTFYNYGHVPIYLLKISHAALTQILSMLTDSPVYDYHLYFLVGRMLSICFDFATLLVLMLLTRKIWANRSISIWAGLIYATAVFPIQSAHFYTVDPQLNFWFLLLTYYLISHWDNPSVKNYLCMGLICGLTAATKFTGVLLLLGPFLLVLSQFVRNRRQPRALQQAISSILIFLLSAVITFFITQPYVLLNFPSFITAIQNQLTMLNDATYFPYTIQFVNTLPYLYPLTAILRWGMGIPVGLITFAGVVYVTVYAIINKHAKLLFLLIFYLGYFAVIGQSAVKYMRYYLPLYPFLAFAGGFLVYQIVQRIQSSHLRLVLRLGLVGTITVWAWMFIQIYLNPHPRITASDWINQNLPAGSTIITEYFDDTLPFINENNYHIQPVDMYLSDDPVQWQNIYATILNGDYYIISSKRIYQSIRQWPAKYSAAGDFYQRLFNDQTSLELIREFTSFPRFEALDFTYFVDDQNSPSSFTIYDHPKVLIYGRKMVK